MLGRVLDGLGRPVDGRGPIPADEKLVLRNDSPAPLARARSGPENVWTDFGHGTSYATAMACIILQLPNNYLPILQK